MDCFAALAMTARREEGAMAARREESNDGPEGRESNDGPEGKNTTVFKLILLINS